MKLNFKQIFYVVFLTVTILSAKEFDLFIKNGRVMDGTGNPWFYADVGINGSKIVYVGRKAINVKAKRIIDAAGLTVAPGFIDIHSHAYDSFRSFPDEKISGGDFDAMREKNFARQRIWLLRE